MITGKFVTFDLYVPFDEDDSHNSEMKNPEHSHSRSPLHAKVNWFTKPLHQARSRRMAPVSGNGDGAALTSNQNPVDAPTGSGGGFRSDGFLFNKTKDKEALGHVELNTAMFRNTAASFHQQQYLQ